MNTGLFMQYLKEELRNKILQTAINQFFKLGFEKTNMRIIARNSHMTVGNLYRYFSNKEQLFSEVVRPVYDSVITLIDAGSSSYPHDFDNFSYLDPILKTLTNICETYRKEMVILISRYLEEQNDALLISLQQLIKKRIKRDLKQLSDEHVKMINHLLFRGVLFILQNSEVKEIESRLREFFIFIFKDIDKRLSFHQGAL